MSQKNTGAAQATHRKRIYLLVSLALLPVSAGIWATYHNDYQPPAVKIATSNRPVNIVDESLTKPYENKSRAEILANIKQQFTPQHYQQQLNQQAHQLRDKLKNTDLVEQIVLKRELATQQRKIKNHQQHYSKTTQLLADTITTLQTFRDTVPAQDYHKAQSDLLQGKIKPADSLLSQIESQNQFAKQRHEINQAAAAVYQRGNIAQNQSDLRKAYRYYRRAVQYNPQHISYLTAAGQAANHMALYTNAIQYYQAALHYFQKENQKEQNKPQQNQSTDTLRHIRINLGDAHNNKGEPDKAIDYFEKALASDIKTHGHNHPNVAEIKNHLGSAWENKGKPNTAADYYSQAARVYEATYGKTHPLSQTTRAHLDRL